MRSFHYRSKVSGAGQYLVKAFIKLIRGDLQQFSFEHLNIMATSTSLF